MRVCQHCKTENNDITSRCWGCYEPLERSSPLDATAGSAEDVDPYETEDYQRYLAECARYCECSHDICESVLAGAPCELRIYDDDDGDDDGYSPIEPYYDEDGCPAT